MEPYQDRCYNAPVMMNQPDTMIEAPCDLCQSSSHTVLFVKEGFRHVRCLNCGMVFVSPRLAAHQDIQRQSGTGAMGEDELTRAQQKRLQRELKLYEPFRQHNRLLEVGAGRGWFLEQAAKIGWETWAVEINSSALEHLKKRRSIHLVVEPAEDFQVPAGTMDAVRIWDVIEHLQSPRAALGRIHTALRPGGLVHLSTTNFASLSRWVNGPEWVYLNGSDHIHLFEPATITALLRQTGFDLVRVRTRSFNLRKKLYHPARELRSAWSLFRPLRKIIDETIRFTRYGHQMIVTAVKRGGNPSVLWGRLSSLPVLRLG
ncbi:MAG: class I SAM-dependent methyltransferase [Thermodesulfobacteriota bacterium]